MVNTSPLQQIFFISFRSLLPVNLQWTRFDPTRPGKSQRPTLGSTSRTAISGTPHATVKRKARTLADFMPAGLPAVDGEAALN